MVCCSCPSQSPSSEQDREFLPHTPEKQIAVVFISAEPLAGYVAELEAVVPTSSNRSDSHSLITVVRHVALLQHSTRHKNPITFLICSTTWADCNLLLHKTLPPSYHDSHITNLTFSQPGNTRDKESDCSGLVKVSLQLFY